MWNICKAIFYEMKIRKKTYLFLVISLIIVYVVYVNYAKGVLEYGVSAFITSFFIISLFIVFAIVLGTFCICGRDLANKTINYEILYGHSRKSIYMSRVVSGIIHIAIMYFIFVVLPLFILTLIYGWGNSCSLSHIIVRILLMFCICVKLYCFCNILSFVFKENNLLALIGVYMLIVFELFIYIFSTATMLKSTVEFVDKYFIHIFSAVQAYKLFAISNAQVGFEDGKDIVLFDASLETSMIMIFIISSIVLSIAYCYIGFCIYRKQDNN